MTYNEFQEQLYRDNSFINLKFLDLKCQVENAINFISNERDKSNLINIYKEYLMQLKSSYDDFKDKILDYYDFYDLDLG